MTVAAPFPYFGGKARVAHIVWERLGNVTNYVEPFFGSGAVLLARPKSHFNADSMRIETVNDIDNYLVNFWRSIQRSPSETAENAAYPVSETDILARHHWLLTEGRKKLDALGMKESPDAHDPKIAGWWVWGLACWIGSGWCRAESDQLPHLGNAGQGVTKKLPHLGNAGQGVTLDQGLQEWFGDLSARLARVRICCGDWMRVLGESVTLKQCLTGIFLDPPYDAGNEDPYATCGRGVSQEVCKWAIENGENPSLRIALCGYEGEHDIPSNWSEVAWKNRGGYASQGSRGEINSARERIWFSPHCLNMTLFEEVSA